MALLDFLKERVQTDGWLSLSSLYFDNGLTINIFNTRGYIAMSDAKECVFTFNCLDSSDTEIVENKLVIMRRDHAGLQQALTVVGYDHMQHFDIAMYANYDYFSDEQEATPYPTIPKEAELTAMEPDPETGLYDSATTDTVTRMSGLDISTIPLYNQFFDPYVKDWQYTGARIDYWKKFYNNHTKFVQMLSDAYGVSDAF